MKNRIFINNLHLNISTACNMKCPRCFDHLESNHNERLMNMDIACSATDLYFKQRNPDHPNPYIMFFGGEPLLNQDLLMEYIPWVNHQYPSEKFRLCLFTNGLALNDTLVDYFTSNHILLFVSLDGEYQTHRKSKVVTPDEYKHIVRMIKRGLTSDPGSVIPYCVIQHEDLHLAHNNLSYIASLGAEGVAVAKEVEQHWEEEDRIVLFDILKELKKSQKLNFLLYPEKCCDCATCNPKCMMVYPNGEIFDLCYTCSSVLAENGTISQADARVMYFGNIKETQELYFDVEQKRELIKSNMRCSFTGQKDSPIETFLAAPARHPFG